MENTQATEQTFESTPDSVNVKTEPVDRIATGVHEAVDRIAEATHQAADTICEKGASLQSLQDEWIKTIRVYISEHPAKAVGIAIAGGFLLSRVLSRRH